MISSSSSGGALLAVIQVLCLTGLVADQRRVPQSAPVLGYELVQVGGILMRWVEDGLLARFDSPAPPGRNEEDAE